MKMLHKSSVFKKQKTEIIPEYRKVFIWFDAFVHCSATTIFTCDKQNKRTVNIWLLKSSKSEVLIYYLNSFFLLLP